MKMAQAHIKPQASAAQCDLIDHAANVFGMKRSEFMLAAAGDHAQDVSWIRSPSCLMMKACIGSSGCWTHLRPSIHAWRDFRRLWLRGTEVCREYFDGSRTAPRGSDSPAHTAGQPNEECCRIVGPRIEGTAKPRKQHIRLSCNALTTQSPGSRRRALDFGSVLHRTHRRKRPGFACRCLARLHHLV